MKCGYAFRWLSELPLFITVQKGVFDTSDHLFAVLTLEVFKTFSFRPSYYSSAMYCQSLFFFDLLLVLLSLYSGTGKHFSTFIPLYRIVSLKLNFRQMSENDTHRLYASGSIHQRWQVDTSGKVLPYIQF